MIIGVLSSPRKGYGNFLASQKIQTDPSQIGRALKSARESAGLSQKATAARVGVDVITVSRWERGVRRPPRAAVLLLAELLGVEPESLGERSAEGLGNVPRATYEQEAPPATGAVRSGTPAQVSEAVGAVDRSDATVTRVARNLPLRIRVYLDELRLRLTKAGADEEEIDRAMQLLRSPSLFTWYSTGTPKDLPEEKVLQAMRAIADAVILPELRARGRKV